MAALVVAAAITEDLMHIAPLNRSLVRALFWTVMVLGRQTGETLVLPPRRPVSRINLI